MADARDLLSAADHAASLAVEDLERLAVAAYLVGEYAESMDFSRRAYRESIAAGDTTRAVRSAFWVAVEHLGRGEMAPAAGWLAKAERLVVEGSGEGMEAGYLLIASALQSMAVGDPSAALSAYEQAAEIGKTFADADLFALAQVGVGEALIGLGEIERGIGPMDEAMVDVTSGEVSPVVRASPTARSSRHATRSSMCVGRRSGPRPLDSCASRSRNSCTSVGSVS